MDPDNQTESIVRNRARFGELIAVAVVVALGVNIASGGALLLIKAPPAAIVGIGLALVIAGSVYVMARVVPRTRRDFSFAGVLPIDASTREVVPIPRYEFAEDTARHVRALCAENKGLARIWQSEPLSGFELTEPGVAARRESQSGQLAREAIEYFVLNELSLHLSAHFNNNSRIDDSEIVTVGRRDIPSFLLENRFLSLFSTPMEERDAFGTYPRDQHKVVYATGRDGALFDHFELILPRATRVSRNGRNGTTIDTKRFSMVVTARFDGLNEGLPRRFEEMYLHRQFREVVAYAAGIDVHVRFKPRAWLTASGWEYYRWLDSFLNRLSQGFSFERFIREIGWATALTVDAVLSAGAESGGDRPANQRLPPTADEQEVSDRG